jgi:hypothetical protein
MVFKIFNRIDTWTALAGALGEVDAQALLTGAIDEVLAERAAGRPVYSPAYIMPPPRMGSGPKFRRHLDLLRQMIRDQAHLKLQDARSMREAFEVLSAYGSIGPFLAFQFVTDLNYSEYLHFSETEFVVAGPGALRGLRKCISDPRDYSADEIIRWVMDEQATAFEARALSWSDLWGRPLQLVDIQNLFCEVDKYTRAAHPELSTLAPGKRIKQRYTPAPDPMTAWFPPKWRVNARVPAQYRPPVPAGSQLSLLEAD